MDVYRNFAELKADRTEGTDYRVRLLRRPVDSAVILAPHGGAIEPGTSEVARWIAGDDCSLGLFEGIRPCANRNLHITSTHFDEPRCLGLIQRASTVVAVHGERGAKAIVYLGGRDAGLLKRVGAALKLRGFDVRRHPRPALQGKSLKNICNRGLRRAGVQIELSLGLRKSFFAGVDTKGRNRPTERLKDFAEAVREGIGVEPCVSGR
jgi:phage replication-related protein YjqB (UPF0714/DUF867 family)